MTFKHLFLLPLSLLMFQVAFADEPAIDPYEPLNRVVFNFNEKVDQFILTPVAKGYRAVVPSPARTGVSNFFDNLRDVVSFGSNILRLDIEKASIDIMRVGINSVFGIGGLMNIADLAQMPNHKNTLGDTLKSWGWKKSNYLVWPILGPSTVRDGLGSAVIMVYSPERALVGVSKFLYPISGFKYVSLREQYLDYSENLDAAALDKYAYIRDLYLGMHASPDSDQDIDIDELIDNDDIDSSESASTTEPNVDIGEDEFNQNTLTPMDIEALNQEYYPLHVDMLEPMDVVKRCIKENGKSFAVCE